MGTKISALNPDAAPTLTDLLVTVDVEGAPQTTKKITVSDLLTLIAANATAPIARVTGEEVAFAGPVAPTGWLLEDGSNVSRTTYANLFNAICYSKGTFTTTIAAPGVMTLNTHGLQTGDQVYLTTTGALPTGLTANTLYYVVRIDANTFNLATSRANAYAGTKITTSGTQSGTHTLRLCPFGLGDGSTTFTLPDSRGRTIAGNDYMGGTAAGRLNLADALGTYGNLGASGGEQRHTMTAAELVAHKHGLNGNTGVRYYTPDINNGTTSPGGAATWGAYTMDNAGSTTPFNIISPTRISNWMIKT